MSNGRLRVLVTSFAPYGKMREHTALLVVQRLQQKPDGVGGAEVVAREVSSEFFTCIRDVESLMKELSPAAVVMLGEYPGRAMVTLERVAINFNDTTRYGWKDEAGNAPQGTPVVQGGPAAYFSTLPLRRIVKDLRAKGVPADITGDAGTLLCNHLMYGVMHNVATTGEGRDPAVLAGWVHLPVHPEAAALEENLGMPSMTVELSTKAVQSVIQSLVAASAAGGGDIDEPCKSRLLV